jgi:hypothetical protein
MATDNPTGSGAAVAVKLAARHAEFLEQVFAGIQEGLLGDLAEFPDGLRDPDRSRREAEICGRVLAALNGGLIVQDRELLTVLREAAWANDDANEYERVIFEHRAFCALLGQIEAGGIR